MQASCRLPQLSHKWGCMHVNHSIRIVVIGGLYPITLILLLCSRTATYADGEVKSFKDAKVYPGDCENWNWNDNTPPTRHKPGIQVADLREVLACNVSYVVLSKGVNGVLECQQSVLDACKAAQVEVIHELTPVAVARFNELAAANKRVGGVFHSTC